MLQGTQSLMLHSEYLSLLYLDCLLIVNLEFLSILNLQCLSILNLEFLSILNLQCLLIVYWNQVLIECSRWLNRIEHRLRINIL